MSLASGSGGAPFRAGAAVSRSFSVFFAGFWKFLVLMLAPYFVAFGLGFAAVLVPGPVGKFILFFAFLALIVVYAIGQAACVVGATQLLRKETFGLWRAIGVGSGRAVSVFFALLLSGLLAALATMALIVPGIIVYCMFFIVVPVCVVERLGPVGGLGRSRALTSGHRWPIFGLILLAFALLIVGESFFTAITGGAATLERGAATGANSLAFTAILALVGVVAQLAAQAWGVVLTAVVYHDLRVAKEGVDIEQLANVFA